jgi:hypothetical protein
MRSKFYSNTYIQGEGMDNWHISNSRTHPLSSPSIYKSRKNMVLVFFCFYFCLRRGLTMQPRPASNSQFFCQGCGFYFTKTVTLQWVHAFHSIVKTRPNTCVLPCADCVIFPEVMGHTTLWVDLDSQLYADKSFLILLGYGKGCRSFAKVQNFTLLFLSIPGWWGSYYFPFPVSLPKLLMSMKMSQCPFIHKVLV